MATITIKNLAKVEVPAPVSNIYVSNVVRDESEGIASFNLHVEDAPFIGYMCGKLIFNGATEGDKLSSSDVKNYLMTLQIGAGTPIGNEDRKDQAVNIPIGIYNDCVISVVVTTPLHLSVNVDSYIIFSLDTVFENGIIASQVFASLDQIGKPA